MNAPRFVCSPGFSCCSGAFLLRVVSVGGLFTVVSPVLCIALLQNATRILRALFDMVLRAGGAIMAGRMLTLCKVVERQTWNFETPLKQFSELSPCVLHHIEEKKLSLDHIRDTNAKDLGEEATGWLGVGPEGCPHPEHTGAAIAPTCGRRRGLADSG